VARLAYYLGVALTLWTAWQVITGAGVVLAGVLPSSVRLELAAPLTFLLLLLPMLMARLLPHVGPAVLAAVTLPDLLATL
jgi:predicted branched-subunit amino acid permease